MRERTDVRILIVEDDYFVAASVREAVRALGYHVAGEAVNGHEALEMTESLRPDVILMDIRMPDMDGLEAARLIQDRHPTPVVVLTAYQTDELVEQAAEAGVSAYLVKPPDPAQIDRAIAIARARFNDLL